MKAGSSVTNPDVEISEEPAFFAREAERALSAPFRSVKDSFGGKPHSVLPTTECGLNSATARLRDQLYAALATSR